MLLVFHDHHLLPSRDRGHVAAISRVLAAHPGPFRTVGYCGFGCHDRELADWLRLLAAKAVQELVLFNMPADFDRLPAVPADVLRCNSFRRLFMGFWKFPDAGAGLPAGGADGFPHLLELILFGNEMPGGRDLDHLLARSPVLHTFAVSLNKMFERVHLRSQSFSCVLLWHCFVEEVAVMDSPLLERLILSGDRRWRRLLRSCEGQDCSWCAQPAGARLPGAKTSPASRLSVIPCLCHGDGLRRQAKVSPRAILSWESSATDGGAADLGDRVGDGGGGRTKGWQREMEKV